MTWVSSIPPKYARERWYQRLIRVVLRRPRPIEEHITWVSGDPITFASWNAEVVANLEQLGTHQHHAGGQ